MMNHQTLSVLLQDGPASLHRAASVLRRGSTAVSSLTLALSDTPGVLCLTVSVDPTHATTVARQLASLVEVLSVRDLTASRAAPHGAAPPDSGSGGAFLYRAQADGAPGDDAQ